MNAPARKIPPSGPAPGHILGLFPELLGAGGVQEAGRMTATALQKIALRHGASADFLGLNDPPGPSCFVAGGGAIAMRGFGRSKARFVMYGLARSYRWRRGATGVVLAGHPNLAVPARWVQRLSPRLRMIVVAHGIEVWEPLAAYRRRALLQADLVLTPSRDTAQKLAGVQGVPPNKIRLLPWPLSTEFLQFADAPENLPLPHGFPHGPLVLSVGRWAASERYKGLDELICAIAQLRVSGAEPQLVAVGSGDDLPRLRRLASEAGAADRVHFLEGLSREQLAACYCRADVFALPSTGEGFGLVFLEAMAFGKPVVAAACGGATDIVEDGVNGLLVPPRDPERLADALNLLFQDDVLRSRLGQRGAAMVRERYSFSTFQAELDKILSESSFSEGVLDAPERSPDFRKESSV